MFSVITNIYSKETKGPAFMEFFTATGKLFFFTTRDVRCVHHGWWHVSMCAPRVTRHTSIRYSSSCHTHTHAIGLILQNYTGRFIMFSVITNIYSKKTKGPTLMEFFTTTGFFFSTRDVRCVHHGGNTSNISNWKKKSCGCEKFH